MVKRPNSAFQHEIKVGWGDCDPARIAYTGRLPWFALDAINAWWEEHLGQGWYQLELDHDLGMPFVRLEMDFRAPVTPRHRLQCFVWPAKLGDSSIAFRVDGTQDGEICFSTRTVSVFTVASMFKKQSAPPEMRKLLQPYLNEATETH